MRILIILLFVSFNSFGQNPKSSTLFRYEDKMNILETKGWVKTIREDIEDIERDIKENRYLLQRIEKNAQDIEAFKLYETQNINIHLKLDTRNGNVYMVQRKTNETESMEVLINKIPVFMLWSTEEVENYDESKNVIGRYKLYPTQNMWTFLMQDVIYGKTYQVQWSFDIDNRIVFLIDSDYF